jgi:hypothetical protein
MPRFPIDAPIARVKRASPLTMPNHPTLKAPTLRTILTQAQIPREDFLRAFEQS